MTRAILVAGMLVVVTPALAQTPASPPAPGATSPIESTRAPTAVPPQAPAAQSGIAPTANAPVGVTPTPIPPAAVMGGATTSATQ